MGVSKRRITEAAGLVYDAAGLGFLVWGFGYLISYYTGYDTYHECRVAMAQSQYYSATTASTAIRCG